MSGRKVAVAVVAMALVACGSSNPTMAADMGVVVPNDGGMCANHIPDPNNPADPMPGTLIGRAFLPLSSDPLGFTLPDCNGTQHSFYSEAYCSPTNRFTVLSIAAGWCHPCQMESSELTANVVNVYGPRGVRVIQVLVQDPAGAAPNSAFCNQWVSTYNLSVTPNSAGMGNYELMDVDQVLNASFPDGSLPSTLIIDSMGVIRFHEDGATSGLASLTSELDRLLAM
jgi:hypothetical protein